MLQLLSTFSKDTPQMMAGLREGHPKIQEELRMSVIYPS
jgi:hypothetical protein